MRDYIYKKKLIECITASSSFKPVISSGILLLIETEEAYVIEGNSIKNKVENINCFIISK